MGANDSSGHGALLAKAISSLFSARRGLPLAISLLDKCRLQEQSLRSYPILFRRFFPNGWSTVIFGIPGYPSQVTAPFALPGEPKENDNEQSTFQFMGTVSGEVAEPSQPYPGSGRVGVGSALVASQVDSQR